MKERRYNRNYHAKKLKMAVGEFFDHPNLDCIGNIEERMEIVIFEDTRRVARIGDGWSREKWLATCDSIFGQTMIYLQELSYADVRENEDSMRLYAKDEELVERLSDAYGEVRDTFDYKFNEDGLYYLSQDLLTILTFVAQRYDADHPEEGYAEHARNIMRESRSERICANGKQLPYWLTDREASQAIDDLQKAFGFSEL